MNKKLLKILTVAALMLFAAAPLYARPWGIVATQPDTINDPNLTNTESIHTIDFGQSPPAVYGPFLERQITPTDGAGVFDIVMLPGNKKALISTFGNSQVHLVDLKDPTLPVLLGSLDIPFFAEDIDITKDGKTAIVADGGFQSRVAFIDLKTFTLTSVFNLGDDKYANGVAISPKKIAIFPDYFQGKIHYGKINKMRNGLESVRTIALCDEGQTDNASLCEGVIGLPVNVTVSPDGRTALVAIANGDVLFAFEITGKGELIPGDPFMVTGLPGGPIPVGDDYRKGGNQSIAFQNNTTAYVISQRVGLPSPDTVVRNGQLEYPDADGVQPNQLCKLNILGPGRVHVETQRYTLLNDGSSQLFGVDTLAIFKRYALVGNPTVSVGGSPYFNYVAYIDLVTGVLTPIELNNFGIAAGVAIKP